MFLQSLVVVTDTMGLTHLEGVAAMGQDNGYDLVLIVQQVTAVNVCDGNLVLDPFTGKRIHNT